MKTYGTTALQKSAFIAPQHDFARQGEMRA